MIIAITIIIIVLLSIKSSLTSSSSLSSRNGDDVDGVFATRVNGNSKNKMQTTETRRETMLTKNNNQPTNQTKTYIIYTTTQTTVNHKTTFFLQLKILTMITLIKPQSI